MASIFENRYSVGHQVILKPDKIQSFNNLIANNFKVDQSPFEKINPSLSLNLIRIQLGKSIDKKVFLKHKKTSTDFHIFGGASTISSYFLHYHNSNDFKKYPSLLETLQILGFFLNGNLLYEDIEKGFSNKQNWIQNIKTLLNSDFDWHKESKKQILEKIDKISNNQWKEMSLLMAGSTEFAFEKIYTKFLNPNFFHKNINKIYKNNKESKNGTFDVIIYNKKPEFKNVKYDKEGYCYDLFKRIFLQISLKKNKKENQLGKFSTFIKKFYKIPKYEDLLCRILNK